MSDVTVVMFEDYRHGGRGELLFYRTAVISNQRGAIYPYSVVKSWGRVSTPLSAQVRLSAEFDDPRKAVQCALDDMYAKEAQGKGWHRVAQGVGYVPAGLTDQSLLQRAAQLIPKV